MLFGARTTPGCLQASAGSPTLGHALALPPVSAHRCVSRTRADTVMSQSRELATRATSAVPAAAPAAVVGGHPDALRRRQEAELRKQARSVQILDEFGTARRAEWWEGKCTENFICVHTPQEFNTVLEQNADRLVVVDFFVPWCVACRTLFPKLQQLARNNPEVLFVKVNGGDSNLSGFVEALGITRLPYFHFYCNGQLLSHFAANLTKIAYLRAEIATQKACPDAPFESSDEALQA